MYELPDPSILNSLSHTQQEVLRGLVAGRSISAAARAAGVHRATVHLWIRTDATFNRAIDAHRRLRADRIADDLNDLAGSALKALKQIIDDPTAPAAVRYKASIDIVNLAQNQDEGRMYRESNLLASFHAELDKKLQTPQASQSTGDTAEEPIEPMGEESIEIEIEDTAAPVKSTRSAPVRNAPCPCGSRLKYKRCCGKISLQAQAA